MSNDHDRENETHNKRKTDIAARTAIATRLAQQQQKMRYHSAQQGSRLELESLMKETVHLTLVDEYT